MHLSLGIPTRRAPRYGPQTATLPPTRLTSSSTSYQPRVPLGGCRCGPASRVSASRSLGRPPMGMQHRTPRPWSSLSAPLLPLGLWLLCPRMALCGRSRPRLLSVCGRPTHHPAMPVPVPAMQLKRASVPPVHRCSRFDSFPFCCCKNKAFVQVVSGFIEPVQNLCQFNLKLLNVHVHRPGSVRVQSRKKLQSVLKSISFIL